ncbi:MAG: D-alanyl-D-alanine carboxypeptidase family protein [Ahrensia sp.]
MRKFVFRYLAIAAFALLFAGPAYAQLFETRAEQAMLLDVNSGSVLFSKNADTKIPPASLAKLMTMEVVFNALSVGRLTLTDEFIVSENAWRTGGAQSGGSTMFAELGSSITLEDLIKAVVVQSANDGCIIIAEGMAGSEDNFARIMTDRAREIGLTDSVFKNSTGLPAEGQVVTMRDLVKLATHIVQTYPQFYQYYALPSFEWNRILQRNRNPLLSMDIGADGMKTGFTEDSGYAIVGTAINDGRRLLLAMSGLESINQRAEEARKMLEWGRRAFEPFELFKKSDVVGSVRLYGGAAASVPVTPATDMTVLLPLANSGALKARIMYNAPVRAPVEAGDEIAMLRLLLDDEIAFEAPLIAAQSVQKGPIHRQALDALAELATGWIPDF